MRKEGDPLFVQATNHLINKVYHYEKIENLTEVDNNRHGYVVGYKNTGNLHYLNINQPMYIGNTRTSFVTGFNEEKDGSILVKTENSVYKLILRDK